MNIDSYTSKQPLLSQVENLVTKFEQTKKEANQAREDILKKINTLVQSRQWKDEKEAAQFEGFANRLIQAKADPNKGVVKDIKNVVSQLKGGILAGIPNEVIREILKSVDVKDIASIAETSSFFREFINKNPQLLLPHLNQLKDFESRLELAQRLGPLVTELDLSGFSSLRTRDLKNLLDLCPNITSLSLKGCRNITDKDLELIAKFQNLKTLSLSGCNNITDKGIKFLTRASYLEGFKSLDLSNCFYITDTGVKSITHHFKKLQLLDLSQEKNNNPNITDKSIETISKSLKELKSLGLKRCNISYDGVKVLTEKLSKLQELDLSGCPIKSDMAAYDLAKMEELNILRVSNCDLSDSGLVRLTEGLPKLEELDVSNNQDITDFAIKNMAKLKKELKIVDLSNTAVSDEGVEACVKWLPKLQVLSLTDCSHVTQDSRNLAQEIKYKEIKFIFSDF